MLALLVVLPLLAEKRHNPLRKDLNTSLMTLPNMCYNTSAMTPYEICCGSDEPECRRDKSDTSVAELAAALVGAAIGYAICLAALLCGLKLLVSM